MRSSFCTIGDCVEVTFEGPVFDVPHVIVRDAYGHVSFTHEEWTAFLAGVRNGEFDVPPAGDAHELEQAGPPK